MNYESLEALITRIRKAGGPYTQYLSLPDSSGNRKTVWGHDVTQEDYNRIVARLSPQPTADQLAKMRAQRAMHEAVSRYR